MSKIIAREVEPGAIDFSSYFDDDGLKNIGGENCAIYIPGGRQHYGFNNDEYEEIQEKANRIIEGFKYVGENEYYACYKEVMEDCAIPYTSLKCHLLRDWTENRYTSDTDRMADFLTIITGEKWNCRDFCGYSQGDYCEVLYCMAHHSEDGITEIGKFWLGCGTEFIIDGCGGYFVTDSVRWKEGKPLRDLLADYAGCKPDELEIYLYKGGHTVADYELMEEMAYGR
jgi:hypothetical protein